jgi:hypothetical protein
LLVSSAALHACAGSPVGEEERSETIDPVYTPDGAVLSIDAAISTPASDASGSREPMVPSSNVGDTASLPSDAQIAASDPPVAISDARVAEVDARAAAPVRDANVASRDAAVSDAAVRDAAVRDAEVRDAEVQDAAPPPPPPPPPPPACTSPQIMCEASCVDTRSDVAHCGGCGKRCPSGESCVESRCWAAPPAGCTSRTFESRAYLFCNEGRSWREARQSCIGARMELAIIASADENTFARSIGAVTWIGASDQQNEGRWSAPVPGNLDRPEGAALMYTNWRNSEPNNTRRCTGREFGSLCLDGDWVDEDCALLLAEGDWNDDDCGTRQRYICEAY